MLSILSSQESGKQYMRTSLKLVSLGTDVFNSTLMILCLIWSAGIGQAQIPTRTTSRATMTVANVKIIPPGAPGSKNILGDDDLLGPASFLYPLQTRYLLWESRLSDSLIPLNQRGALIYPLLDMNFGGEILPGSLYIPPLRGSDARQ
jgi:hypothetical protein